MSYAGLDYSLGRSNYNPETGIHFGVISSHSIDYESPWNDADADYGDPTCPKCGNKVKASDDDTLFEDMEIDDIVFREGIQASPDGTPDWFTGKDFCCVPCQACYWSDSVYSDEPIGYSYEADGYTLTDCLQTDIMVLSSPYYTFAQYCSPCVPGAGNLDTPCDDGPKTYALGHEWFEGDKAPYRVYSVATGLEVLPEGSNVL